MAYIDTSFSLKRLQLYGMAKRTILTHHYKEGPERELKRLRVSIVSLGDTLQCYTQIHVLFRSHGILNMRSRFILTEHLRIH